MITARGWQQSFQMGGEARELCRVKHVAGEQDHPGGTLLAKQANLIGGQLGAADADDCGFHARAYRGQGARGQGLRAAAGRETG